MKTLARGDTIGIVGGGQLGRMLAMAAAKLGFRIVIVDPQPDCPAAQLANAQIVAAYDDLAALDRMAGQCEVATFEFENVDLGALEYLSGKVPVFPGPWALRVAQDRLVEKTFLRETGIATADFRAIANADQLRIALADLGGHAILKKRRFGYDGKGQIRFHNAKADPTPQQAMEMLAGAPLILEAYVPFECEISVIATRGQDRSVHAFEPARNDHEHGILRTSTVPCGLSAEVAAQAMQNARKVVNALDYVGTLGLEYFVLADGRLVANEIAPRVHNSGHWTEAACTVSQFEQHIRAVAGWPLADSYRHSDCVMVNLLGDDIGALKRWSADGAAMIHDYGKVDVRKDRKMGHVTRLEPR